MTPLHPDEVVVDDETVRRLVDRQFPEWDRLPLTPAGHGTDNRRGSWALAGWRASFSA